MTESEYFSKCIADGTYNSGTQRILKRAKELGIMEDATTTKAKNDEGAVLLELPIEIKIDCAMLEDLLDKYEIVTDGPDSRISLRDFCTGIARGSIGKISAQAISETVTGVYLGYKLHERFGPGLDVE